ncbi:MAG: vWA domain-containing protein [Limisphaerales bacterium]
MSFLAPAAFAFAAAIPVVILFYLLKRKRVVKLVSSTLLWQKFLAESQASAPFQKLRHNWLLVLQLLLLALIIFALSRPYFASDARGGRLLVAILDASASMQSTDVAPSRFEQARGDALRLVDSLHDNDQMVVLLAGGQTEVKQSPSSSKSSLRRAIQGCVAADTPTRLADAIKLAQPLVKDRSGAQIHLFSDGAGPDLTEFETEGLQVVFHGYGERADNAGVVTLDVRSHPENPGQRAVFTSVFNASSNLLDTELELLLDGRVQEARPVTLQPRETLAQVFTAAQTNDGVFTVRLSLTDDLAADNQASIVSLLSQPANVLLVTRGNRFLERALGALAGAQVTVMSDLIDDAREFDLTVLDDVLPAVWPANNTLAIRSAPTNWIQVIGSREGPAIVDWKSTHPLLRFVTFDNVQVAEALAVRVPAWASSIVDAQGEVPLILAGELGSQRLVWLAFDTLQSTWPLRISFPIFMANAVDWLSPATVRATQFLVRAGDPLRLTLTAPLTNAVVRLPDGTQRPITVGVNARELVFGETGGQGIYRVESGTNRFDFCVNLLDAAETDTTPRSEMKFGRYAKVQAAAVTRADAEIWRWFALLGLAVLIFEWWYYHRRTA